MSYRSADKKCRSPKYFFWLQAAVLALLAVLLGASLAVAVSPQLSPSEPLVLPEYETPPAAAAPGIGSLILRITAALGIILLLSYVLLRFLRRHLRVSSGQWIKVVDHVLLGPGRGVFLVDVAGKLIALGITDGQITKLLEIDDPELIRQIQETTTELPEKSFMGLKELLPIKGLEKTSQKTNDYFAQDNFHRLIHRSLRRLRQLTREEEHRGEGR